MFKSGRTFQKVGRTYQVNRRQRKRKEQRRGGGGRGGGKVGKKYEVTHQVENKKELN